MISTGLSLEAQGNAANDEYRIVMHQTDGKILMHLLGSFAILCSTHSAPAFEGSSTPRPCRNDINNPFCCFSVPPLGAPLAHRRIGQRRSDRGRD